MDVKVKINGKSYLAKLKKAGNKRFDAVFTPEENKKGRKIVVTGKITLKTGYIGCSGPMSGAARRVDLYDVIGYGETESMDERSFQFLADKITLM